MAVGRQDPAFLLYAVLKDGRDRAEKEERGLQECSPLLNNLNYYI